MATQQSFYEQDEEYLAEPSIPGYSNAQYDEDDESNQQGYQEYLDANGLAGMNGNGGAGDEELMEREMMEREQQNRLALEMVPEEVKRFIGNFYEVNRRNPLLFFPLNNHYTASLGCPLLPLPLYHHSFTSPFSLPPGHQTKRYPSNLRPLRIHLSKTLSRSLFRRCLAGSRSDWFVGRT